MKFGNFFVGSSLIINVYSFFESMISNLSLILGQMLEVTCYTIEIFSFTAMGSNTQQLMVTCHWFPAQHLLVMINLVPIQCTFKNGNMKMEKDSIPLSKVMKAKIWLFLSNILLMESMILQGGFHFNTIFGRLWPILAKYESFYNTGNTWKPIKSEERMLPPPVFQFLKSTMKTMILDS